MNKKITIKSILENFSIQEFNYKFNDSVISVILNDIENKHGKEITESFDIKTDIEEKSSIQIGVHNELKKMFVVIDTSVQEIIDGKNVHEEDSEDRYTLKTLDISVKFNFLLESKEESSIGLSDNNHFMEKLQEHIEVRIIEDCRINMVNIIKQLTSIDYQQSIKLNFPENSVEIEYL